MLSEALSPKDISPNPFTTNTEMAGWDRSMALSSSYPTEGVTRAIWSGRQ